MEGKVCHKCKIFKSFENFNKLKKSNDGFQRKCKQCAKQHYLENKERYAENHKKYVKENFESVKSYKSKWFQENKDEIYEQRLLYYRKNKEKIDAINRKWAKNNPERAREIWNKSVAKRRAYRHKVDFKTYERKELLDRDNWICQQCGIKVHDDKRNTPDKAHIDHIIPISKGGNSEPSNLQVLCRTCNLTKSDKVVL